MMFISASKKASAVGSYVIGTDHRACYDEKCGNQHWIHMRASDDGATTPAVAAVAASMSRMVPEVNQAILELTVTLVSRTMIMSK